MLSLSEAKTSIEDTEQTVVTVTVCDAAIITSSKAPGTEPRSHVDVELQSPVEMLSYCSSLLIY